MTNEDNKEMIAHNLCEEMEGKKTLRLKKTEIVQIFFKNYYVN